MYKDNSTHAPSAETMQVILVLVLCGKLICRQTDSVSYSF